MPNVNEQSWRAYVEETLPMVTTLLQTHQITLDTEQPHIKGERFLMQAMTTAGGQKLILLGTHTETQSPVVIKIATDRAGKEELVHERTCRQLLHTIDFAYDVFHSPEEVLFISNTEYTLAVHTFIPQRMRFLDRPLAEQFNFALQSFKAQESARATTHKHLKQITHTFGLRTGASYLRLTEQFLNLQRAKYPSSETTDLIKTVRERIKKKTDRIEQYCGFLTHTDFVPHNFRIHEGVLYLLDFSSLRFGNKHESWARFLNFMTLYNPELEAALVTYVESNRSQEERESLQLMRLYRLIELISYYTKTLDQSDGDLLELNKTRIIFWCDVLKAELDNTRVSRAIVDEYQMTRDKLRSSDEKERQQVLH